MVYICYLRKRVVYLPVLAKEKRGGHRTIDPVAVAPVSDEDALRRAFHETIAQGNPVVTTALQPNYPEFVVLKHAGVKDYTTFTRGTLTWIIEKKSGEYRIIGQRRLRGAWVDDPDQTIALPQGAGVDDLIERMIGILQAATKQ